MQPITATGNAFFKGSERFYIRGIDYQPGGASANLDPLADTKICKPDVEKFKKLGVNTIRVYSTDNAKNHDECMKLLADAGIYVVFDANNPKYSINRNDPHGSYNELYLQSVFATIDAFAKYENTMAFFSGNEVIHDLANTTLSAKYVKATDRDMRAYIKARGYRKILVGYSAADVTTNRMETAAYFNCGPQEHRSDFFAFNDYSWCSTNFIESGWDKKVKNFTGYGLPIFLSEYGCNHNVRDFGEIEALMHSNMTSVYSGGLMYEYTMEANKFGIVKIKGGDTRGGVDQTGEREELKPEFANFQAALKKWSAPKGDGGYSKESKASECPQQSENWVVDNNLPKMPEGAKKFLTNGAGTPPGLNGDGSQWATYLAATEFEDGSKAKPDGTSDGSGTGTNSAGSSKSSSAAVRGAPGPFDKTPFVISGIVALMTMLGAAAL